jgi:hypothetical protein
MIVPEADDDDDHPVGFIYSSLLMFSFAFSLLV